MSDTVSRRSAALCNDEVSLIMDYLNGEFDSTTNASFEMHLSECADCAAFLNTYKKTILKVRTVYNKIPASMKVGVQLAIKEKITRQLSSKYTIEIHNC